VKSQVLLDSVFGANLVSY